MKMNKLIAGTLVGTLLMSQSIFAGTTLTFNGNATIEEAPDVAYVDLNLQGKGLTNEAAKANVTSTLNSLVEILTEDNLVDKSEIIVSNFSFYKDWDYSGDKAEEIGYIAEYNVKITVNNVKNVEAILDKVAKANSIGYSYVSYGLKNDDDLYERALAEAVKAALGKADALVDTFFQSSDYTITEITENSYNYYEPIYASYDRVETTTANSNANAEYSTPDIKTTASVVLKIEIDND